MNEQTIWTPAGQDITINWRLKYNYVPASEQPDIKAKHEYYRERKWATQETEQIV
jgi:hypothetical protein